MSVYTANTSITSILKTYVPSEREKAKNYALNKVRFTMPKEKGLIEVVELARKDDNFKPVNELIFYLRESELNDTEFLKILNNARKLVNELSPKFTNLVETILALKWTKRNAESVVAYTEFCIDVMVAHNQYLNCGIPLLISHWIPADTEGGEWPNGMPIESKEKELEFIHKLLDRILTAIPLSFDLVWDTIEAMFPYYKKAPHVIAGYLHNVLWLLDYKPMFAEFILQMVLEKMLILDVNAPRGEIEETDGVNDENDDESETEQMEDDVEDDEQQNDGLPMNHPIAYTLDICMEKLYQFFDKKNQAGVNLSEDEKIANAVKASKFLKLLLNAFDEVVLPSHNTHHIQFIIFYYCSFRPSLAEAFLSSLWDKIKNPNVSAVIRQAAVGYIASFLARSKYLPIAVLKTYLKELCNWAHMYIDRCDQYRSNGSLKANLVFFSVCQAIFYVIAFRSRDLTVDKKSLLFLQSLHLSTLVTCNFNPLRVCFPAVATAFSGVTRAYQLAYCHAILERNARRKLATVYANDTATPEETLDTFFPFDPYLLKFSGKRIAQHYLQYQASEIEEQASGAGPAVCSSKLSRKRGDSEMIDEVDDFIIADKRQKYHDIGKSKESD